MIETSKEGCYVPTTADIERVVNNIKNEKITQNFPFGLFSFVGKQGIRTSISILRDSENVLTRLRNTYQAVELCNGWEGSVQAILKQEADVGQRWLDSWVIRLLPF